jgi:signal transduction histidine kinase
MIRRDSIQSRLILVALAIIVCSTLAVGYTGVRLTGKFLGQGYHESFALLAANLAGSAEVGIMLDDREMLQRLTCTTLEQRYVEVVAILDNGGTVLAESRAEGLSHRERMARATAPVQSLQLQGEELLLAESGAPAPVGTVEVYYNLSGLDELQGAIARQFFLVSLVMVLAAVLIYWFMARLITIPLTNLVEVSREVSKGRLDIRATGGRFHETRTLAATFNEMLAALARQRRELQAVNEQIARQQTLAEVGRFSMMLAHEIKNPLAIIRGSLDILKKGGHDADTIAMLHGYLDDEIGRINTLLEDFLLFARPRQPNREELDLAALVQDVVRRLELAAGDAAPRIELQLPAAPCIVAADRQLIERALMNLAKNALDAGAPDQPVTITIAPGRDRCHVTVADRGGGIAAENLARVFTPFFTTKAKGTGLGLAIAQEIVTAHGGGIKAVNRAGGGAVFSFWLPNQVAGGGAETPPIHSSQTERKAP